LHLTPAALVKKEKKNSMKEIVKIKVHFAKVVFDSYF
jgi:hypothetical protein